MKRSLIELLVCPRCRDERWEIIAQEESGEEILTGEVRCACGRAWPIVRGILRTVPDDAYVGSFSFQWQLHRRTQLDTVDRRDSYNNFLVKTGVDPQDFSGRRVLDVGVGTGRYADVVQRAGAEVVGIDLSLAVETAMANVGGRPAAHVVQADCFNLPFAPESFDLIYSVGVLHHTPDCRRAFLSLIPYLKPGGTIAVWVYSAHHHAPGSVKERVNLATRAITSRLPNRLLYFLCLLELPLYFLRKIPGFDQALHLLLPGAIYHAIPPSNRKRRVTEHILDLFDWYSPKYQSKHEFPEVFGWFEEAGLERIRVLPYHVSVCGRKPETTAPARNKSQRRAAENAPH